MTNKIDTDMTASYLNAVQSEIIKANETIAKLESELSKRDSVEKAIRDAYRELLKENTSLKVSAPAPAEWHPATETPQDEERVIVRTTEGATFMYEPCNGKWPKWVEKWMYIPQ